MNSICEPVTDLFLTLDAKGHILDFVPSNPLFPFASRGDSLRQVYGDSMPAAQIDSLIDQLHRAQTTARLTHRIFDLSSEHVTKSYLALFLPMNRNQILMAVREVTRYTPFQSLLNRQFEELTALAQIGKTVFGNLNRARALQLVIDQTVVLLRASQVSILLSESREWFKLERNRLHLIDRSSVANLEIDEYVLRTGKTIHASGLKIQDANPLEVKRAPQSIIAAPLCSDFETFGVVEALANDLRAFDITDLRLLNSVAVLLAIAVANARPSLEIRIRPEHYPHPLESIGVPA